MLDELYTYKKQGGFQRIASSFHLPACSCKPWEIESSGAKRGTKGIKGSSSTSAGKKGLRDSSTSGSTSEPPPAIVLRAPKVQAQTRLHGKPASSFFARGQALTAAGALIDEASPPPARAIRVSALNSTEQQTAKNSESAVGECSAEVEDAKSVVKPHPTRSVAGDESATSMASVVSAPSAVSNAGACASARGSCASGSASLLEATTDSASSTSRNIEEDTTPGSTTNRSKPRCITRSATMSRGTFGRAGQRGVGRGAANADGGWNVPTVSVGPSSLDGELMLLDGILHDKKVRKWVETTLVPAKKR